MQSVLHNHVRTGKTLKVNTKARSTTAWIAIKSSRCAKTGETIDH